jgi:hypothetical protein
MGTATGLVAQLHHSRHVKCTDRCGGRLGPSAGSDLILLIHSPVQPSPSVATERRRNRPKLYIRLMTYFHDLESEKGHP